MTNVSRILALLTLTFSASVAMAGTGYVFLQPSPTKCPVGGTACLAKKQSLNTPPAPTPPGGPAPEEPTPTPPPSPDAIALAEQHIDQAWELAFEAGQGNTGTLASLGVDYDTLRFTIYSVGASMGTPTYTRDTQNRVLSSVQVASASASRGGVTSEACAVIASKGLAGVGCSGGTISVSIQVRVNQSWVEAGGAVRDYQTEAPVSRSSTWLTATQGQVTSATPAAPGFGVVQGI